MLHSNKKLLNLTHDKLNTYTPTVYRTEIVFETMTISILTLSGCCLGVTCHSAFSCSSTILK